MAIDLGKLVRKAWNFTIGDYYGKPIENITLRRWEGDILKGVNVAERAKVVDRIRNAIGSDEITFSRFSKHPFTIEQLLDIIELGDDYYKNPVTEFTIRPNIARFGVRCYGIFGYYCVDGKREFTDGLMVYTT